MLLLKELEQAFLQNADELRAKKQSAYMRDLFLFLGLSAPLRRALQKPFYKAHPIQDEWQLNQMLKYLWNKEQREFQYAGLDAAASFRKLASTQLLETYEWMIRTKSWWDTVDDIAANLVGTLLLKDPNLTAVMDRWIQDENLWIRRTALIFQLKWREQTDKNRLFSYCLQASQDTGFFIRKAIGWALRQYSKTNPTAVKEFIQTHQYQLSPLSIKEGSKYIPVSFQSPRDCN